MSMILAYSLKKEERWVSCWVLNILTENMFRGEKITSCYSRGFNTAHSVASPFSINHPRGSRCITGNDDRLSHSWMRFRFARYSAVIITFADVNGRLIIFLQASAIAELFRE